MKTTDVTFKNRPNGDGTLTAELVIKGCLIANNGSPTSDRPQILIHLPKTSDEDVSDAWVDYEGHSYHVVGTSVPQMDSNTPTPWNRYVIAERPTRHL